MKNWPIRGQTDTWAHQVSYWQEKRERESDIEIGGGWKGDK